MPFCSANAVTLARNAALPALTRKRVHDRPEIWHVHYDGVRVGVIVERSGAPPSSDQWQWICGFYPGSNPGDDRHGTAASFAGARADGRSVSRMGHDLPALIKDTLEDARGLPEKRRTK
jgi:hypothetical protein